MRRTYGIAAALLITASSPGRADDAVKLEPNAKLTFDFPALPQTFFSKSTHQDIPARLVAQLPENYTADGKFPLFVFLDGGNGGPGNSANARTIVGPRDFITVGLPLFKDPAGPRLQLPPGIDLDPSIFVSLGDAAILGSSYKVMLQKLLDTVPNITAEHSAFGGFSNGAHATAALIVARDPFILNHFTSFCFFEGGLALLFDPSALEQPELRHSRLILIRGDHDADPKLQLAREELGTPLFQAFARQASDLHLDFTQIVMHGYGHATPPQYQKLLGQWVRGETLPDAAP
jgi:hypothetical protein